MSKCPTWLVAKIDPLWHIQDLFGLSKSGAAIFFTFLKHNMPKTLLLSSDIYRHIVFLLSFVICSYLYAQSHPQHPSPMVDFTRKHQRVQIDSLSGKRFQLKGILSKIVEGYLPQNSNKSNSLRLLVHFHGAAYVAMHAVEESSQSYLLANINLGSGSSVYEEAFFEESTFINLLQSIRDSLKTIVGRERKFSGIYLSSFSAGYGAARAILKQPEAVKMIDGIILLDGLHTDYVPEGQVFSEGGKLNTQALAPFLNFAKLAIEGKKLMLITHSEIFPGTYASTTETADYLIQQYGLQRQAVLKWGVLGMQQLSVVRKGRFTVLGFAGNSAPDHIDHFHALFEFLKYFY
jgi:hypothetical protein